jgi:hypothetical protein
MNQPSVRGRKPLLAAANQTKGRLDRANVEIKKILMSDFTTAHAKTAQDVRHLAPPRGTAGSNSLMLAVGF